MSILQRSTTIRSLINGKPVRHLTWPMCLIVACCASLARAAIPPAGSTIASRSVGEYIVGSDRLMVYSNEITTTVSALYSVRLSPTGDVSSPAVVLQGEPGDTVYARFSLLNAGNADDSVRVTSAVIPPSTIGIRNIFFFRDANGSGGFDPGEDDRRFLNLRSGESTALDVGCVLAPGAGPSDTYVEIRAGSTGDELIPPQTSVVLVQTLPVPSSALHVGPHGNARALPGGDGSDDDRTIVAAGIADDRIVFTNDILNESTGLDLVQIEVVDTASWPSGVTITLLDSLGQPLQVSGTAPEAFVFGAIDPGETRSVRAELLSPGRPFSSFMSDTLSFRLRAVSIIDSTRYNTTRNAITFVPSFTASAVIGLSQTFRQNVAAFGDVVTMNLTVANTTDSVPVRDVIVTEYAHPSLDFLSSPTFENTDGTLVWRAGALAPHEKREAVIKFVVNSRMLKGEARVTGRAEGTAMTGAPVTDGPLTNVIQIDNDIFSDEGFVMGQVFVDDDGDGRRDRDEPGVGGVAFFLESGEYALSDSFGVFSIPRVFSGFRVVRMDESTLPDDFYVPGEGEEAESGGRRFERLVRLLPSGHASVNFPVKRVDVPRQSVEMVQHRVTSQELVTMQKQARFLYQIPSVPSTYFAVGKAYLKSGFENRLDPIQRFLQQHPDWQVLLEGHTDSVPIHNDDFASNDELSLARAQAIERYLGAHGIGENRIHTRGFADRRPVATNETAEGRARNRRVEVGFIPPGLIVGDELSLQRVRAELDEITAVDDTFLVRVLVDLSSDNLAPMTIELVPSLPAGCSDASIDVRHDGRMVAPVGERYVVDGFARSHGIQCEMTFRVATADTHRVGDVALELGTIQGAAVTSREGPDSTRIERVILHPARAPMSEPTASVVWTWEEAVAGESSAGAAALTGGPMAVATGGRARHDSLTTVVAVGDSLRRGEGADARGILLPADGAVVSHRDQIEVVIRVPLGSRIELMSGGRPVPEDRIGERVVRVKDRLEELSFYGVRLVAGWNDIVLHAIPPRGEALIDTVRVALAGRPVSIVPLERRVVVPADGRTRARVRMAVLDPLQLPAIDGIVATVDRGDSLLTNADARPNREGLQLVSRDGHFTLLVGPSRRPARHTIELRANDVRTAVDVIYVPPSRAAFLTGIVEGRLGAFDSSGDGDPLGVDNYDDGVTVQGESRLFVQGTTYAGINLTARVDTKKRVEDPLLNTMNSNRQYPIYGDASELRFAAPAQGGNYLALEKGESYLRYGDFRTPMERGEFLRYRRAASGVNAALVSGDHGARAFVTKTDFVTARDEIPGDGTSGFYYLSGSPVVENSETVVIETRDRFRPERKLEMRPLVQHRDYTINYFSGSILFKEPIPVTSSEFDPVTIVVIYEVKTDGDGDYLYGFRGDVAQTGRFRLGGTVVADGEEEVGYALYGVDGGGTLGPFGVLGEFARSDDDVTGVGNAYKVEASYNGTALQTSLYFRDVDESFTNPSLTGSAHELASRKAGYDFRLNFSRQLAVVSDGFHHRFNDTGDERESVMALAKATYPWVAFSGGLRAANQTVDAARRDALLTLAGLGIRKPGRFELLTHWEKNLRDEVVDEFPDRLTSTLTVPVTTRTRVRINHEYLTAHGRPATHQLLAGVESKVAPHSTVYTRYALSRTASDERMGTITGLKQKVPIRRGLAGSFDIEMFKSFSSQLDDEYVAMKSGLTWRRPREITIQGGYEYRWQRASVRHLLRLDAVREFPKDLSIVFQDALALSYPDNKHAAVRMEGRLAAVYRPLTSIFRTLLMLRTEYDRFSPVDPQAITWRLVFSNDINICPTPSHEFRLKLAAKRVEDYSLGISETTHGYLVLGHYVYHFDRNWDLDLWGRYLTQDRSGSRQLGSGVELGYLLLDRIRIAGGYSLSGFEDRDLAENDAWSRGFGVRVQLILSDWILTELGR